MNDAGQEPALDNVTVRHFLFGEITPGGDVIVGVDEHGNERIATFTRVTRLPVDNRQELDEGRIMLRMPDESEERECKPSIFGLIINYGSFPDDSNR